MSQVKTLNDVELKQVSSLEEFSPEQIQALRKRNKVSQAVLAKIMNTSPSSVKHWEIGHRKPGGTSLKLLNLINRHGIEILL